MGGVGRCAAAEKASHRLRQPATNFVRNTMVCIPGLHSVSIRVPQHEVLSAPRVCVHQQRVGARDLRRTAKVSGVE